MRILLVHQNFPGQYRHLAGALRRLPGVQVVALGDARNLANVPPPTGLQRLTYSPAREPTPGVHPYLRNIEAAVLRGQAVARIAQQLRRKGFVPDLICAHAAWGEALYLRDVFPDARILGYMEFYYQAVGADIGFDPEFPATTDDLLRIRTWNMVHQSTYFAIDQGMSPTEWQASQFPVEMRQRLSVIHDGIDTDALQPLPGARFDLADGRSLGRDDEVITFVSRGLEPYRGFHVFMRALPDLLARRPRAQVVIVGRDRPSYGRAPQDAPNWREKLLGELGDRIDPARVHFTGILPYARFLSLLQVSRAHVYLTYPFVLSWSLLEAMALGAPIVASDTPPVREVIQSGRSGLLVDFFDAQALVERTCELLDDDELRTELVAQARRHVVARYDLRRVCLPAQLALAHQLLERGPVSAPGIRETPAPN
jgi:glycosyltransferase involved in cell wall biosynthesis